MAKKKNHIVDALESIAKAQQELEGRVDRHEKIIESQGQNIARLEQQVMALRNQAIQAEIASGERSDAVAQNMVLRLLALLKLRHEKIFTDPNQIKHNMAVERDASPKSGSRASPLR